jgi:predicted nucleic acid-binding protein
LNSKNQTILNHAANINFPLVTSITGIGEAIDQIRKHADRSRLISSLVLSFDDWNITSLYTDPVVADICYRLATEGVDYRIENTDRVHLGYAFVYGCELFITTDKNLLKYRVPKNLKDAGFVKPCTITLEKFKEYLN